MIGIGDRPPGGSNPNARPVSDWDTAALYKLMTVISETPYNLHIFVTPSIDAKASDTRERYNEAFSNCKNRGIVTENPRDFTRCEVLGRMFLNMMKGTKKEEKK